jgi:hypothetical protein
MKPSFRVVLPLVGLMACVGDDPVAAPVVDAGGGEASVTDAGADAPSTAACDPNKDFGPPVLVEELRSNLGEYGFTMNAAQTVAIFGRGNDVIQVRRSGPDAPFTGAAPLQLPPAPSVEGQMIVHSLSSDGLIILRGAGDGIGTPFTEVFSRPTVDAAFGAPVRLTIPGGQPFQGRFTVLAGDGSSFYWLEPGPQGRSVLFQVPRLGTTVNGATQVTDFYPGAFALSYDGLVLYFTRKEAVFRATRATHADRFAGSQEITSLTIPQGDGGLVYPLPTHVTRDDCSLYVTIGRVDGAHIYVAKRPK